MPRSARDSDEDVEIIRIGRRTRAGIGPAIPESPIRRSSRNKQSTKQNDSSPEVPVIDTSNTQTSRSFRTRAGTIDSNSLEIQRRLRSKRNTVDMNEAKETEVSTETQPKIMTRRSIAAMNASETPKANTRVRRLTRAGSETKTTPTGRVTRKTRASSMDPESMIENPIKEKYDSHVIETPTRTKRRASVLPSESTVVEEEEKQIPYSKLENPVIEEDELIAAVINVSSKNVEPSDKELTSSKNEPNEESKNTDKMVEEKDCSAEGSVEHSSQNDNVKISENVINDEPINKEKLSKSDENKLLGNDKDNTNNMEVTLTTDVICNISTDSLHSVEIIAEKIESKDKDILDVSLEEGEINTSNKENECLNTSNPISKQNKNESILNVSLEEGEINTSNKENECLNIDSLISEQNKSVSNTKKLNLETSTNVLDTSTKEDKNNQCNDNTKLGNSCLMECSVAILNCDTLIKTFKASNEIQNENLCKENNNVSILDIKEVTCNEKHDYNDTEIETNDKNNIDNIVVEENSDVLNAVTQKMLNEEDTIPKQQPLLNDASDTQIQNTTIKGEEDNSKIANQSTKNTKEVNCEIESEVNVSVISNNAVNISVNPKEDLMDISIEENSCTKNVERTEIANVNNDIKESTTPKDSHIEKDDVLSSNENQDSTSTSTHDSPTITLQVSDNSIEEPVHNAEQIELHSSECLIDLQSSKPSNSILETNDTSTVAEFHDGPEEDLHDEEGSKVKLSSETPKISKRKSVTELNISKTEEEAQKDAVQSADESDNISNVGMLFQDISADEWKQKRQIVNSEGENNSIHSTSTVKLENDSETECDLVLVDKEAWLAAENLKTMKNKETFDYDSDDTIVLKSKIDYINDKISSSDQTQILSKDSTQENDNDDGSKLLSKKTQDTLNKKTNIDECDVNVSLQNTSKKEKSLNISKEDISNNSKCDLVKSSDKQLEEEVELTLSQKESEDHNKSENKLASPILDRKEKKNRSLNSSSNKKSKLKKASKKYNRLHISSSDEEEEEGKNSEDNKNKIKSSEKKRNNKNYSTMVHIGSDSDTCNSSSNSSKSNTKNQSLRIPCFLFKHKNSGDESEEHGESDDECNEDKSSKGSIDSDIDLEYNLSGKTIGKFSDDDIPGDECRASESESSDPDDNGSDLADFVVDDDEVEEEEDEDEDEDENENEDEEKEEEEEEKEEQDQEQEQEQEEEEDEESDQEMKDEEVTEDKNERKGNDILPSEEKERDTSTKNFNVSNIKSDKNRNKKQKTSSETHSAESVKGEIVADSKVNNSIKLDSTLSEKKKKKKQKLNENNETIEETPKSHLNANESDTMFTQKTKVANLSLTCSTPKTDFHEHEQFKHNISSEKKKRRYIEKTSVNEETEKVCVRNLSTDNFDNNKTSLTNSVNAKKRYSVEKNISADSLELVKGINLPRSLLSKKAHLNKTMSPSSETPTTKYLKKQKLNDSAPLIKLEETKRTSKNISLSDNTKDIAKQVEATPVISEKTIDVLEFGSSLSAKRKKSIDLVEQTELRHKKLIFETGQISEVDEKAESPNTSDNEKENSKCKLKVDDGKKKKKKNKKNTSFQELDILDMQAKMVEEENNDEKVEVISNIESKKNKKKNKNKKNVENEDKRNDKSSLCFSAIQSFQSNDAKNYKKCTEVEDIPNKKKKKVTSEIPSLQVKEHSKKSLGWNVSEGSTSTNVEFPNNARENMEFLKSKHEALQAAKRAAESIKANKHLKKTMRTEHLEKMQPKKEIRQQKIESTIMATSKRGIKRLSVDIIENLSDAPMRPHKKQKLSQKPVETTSNTIIKNGFTESGVTRANKKCILSNCGSTTEFDVVNLQKAKKQSKKISAVATFRQKILSRNSRYPVTSYIMYLQKQRALSGDHGFVKQF